MSTTTIYVISADGDGNLLLEDEVAEYKNSHGWCAFVWQALMAKFGISKLWLMGGAEELWASHAAKTIDLAWYEAAVLNATYDKATLSAARRNDFVSALREFDAQHPGGLSVSHLFAMATDLEALDTHLHVAWEGTSLSEWWGEDFNFKLESEVGNGAFQIMEGIEVPNADPA